IDRAVVRGLEGEFLTPQRGADIFGLGAAILRAVVDRRRHAGGLEAVHLNDARGLRAGPRHIRVIHPGIPRHPRVRRAIDDRRGVALDAEIDPVQVGQNAAFLDAGIQVDVALQWIRYQTGRQRQVIASDSVPDRLRAGAVDVRRLIPDEREVLLTGLRRGQHIRLVAEALKVGGDVVGPQIDLVETIAGAGGDMAAAERARRHDAVLVVLRQTLLPDKGVTAGGEISVVGVGPY